MNPAPLPRKRDFLLVQSYMKRIAIQGTLGSYHDIAAHRYFEGEDIELICCATFEEVFNAIRQDSHTIGMLAIENTIAGSLLHNYELLRQSGTQVVGEYKLRISHSFVCLPEDDWDSIQEVHSHPIALMQCRDFLSRHPHIKVVEGEDTALSAEIIHRDSLYGHAAICSKYAAELYGMKVLEEGIETNKHNFTRFLVVADPWQVDDLNRQRTREPNKASMVFTLPHQEGSLSQVLSILSFYRINLTKIARRPPGRRERILLLAQAEGGGRDERQGAGRHQPGHRQPGHAAFGRDDTHPVPSRQQPRRPRLHALRGHTRIAAGLCRLVPPLVRRQPGPEDGNPAAHRLEGRHPARHAGLRQPWRPGAGAQPGLPHVHLAQPTAGRGRRPLRPEGRGRLDA